MKVDIVGRQIEITPPLREFAEEKLRKLERLLDGPLDVHVVLSVEKHRHMAEIQVKSRTAVLSGAEETSDLYASIGEVVDKLERQAQRRKEKVADRRRREGQKAGEAAVVLQAYTALEEHPEAEAPARVVRTERYRLKPMSPEDAVLELEGTKEEILVFRDSDSFRVNVVYRLKDGHFGLIDPEF